MSIGALITIRNMISAGFNTYKKASRGGKITLLVLLLLFPLTIFKTLYPLNLGNLISNGDNTHYAYLAAHFFDSFDGLLLKFPARYEHLLDYNVRDKYDFNHNPLYTVFLAILFVIFGKSLAVAVVFNAILGAVSVVLSFVLGKLIARSNLAGIIVAVLMAFDIELAVQVESGITHVLDLVFALLALIFMVRTYRSYSIKHIIGLTIATALAYLTRTQEATLVITMGLALLFIPNANTQRKIQASLIFWSLSFLIVSPWFLRNYYLFGSPTFNINNFIIWMPYYQDYHQIPEYTPSMSAFFQNTDLVELWKHFLCPNLRAWPIYYWRYFCFLPLIVFPLWLFVVRDESKRVYLILACYIVLNIGLNRFLDKRFESRHFMTIIPVFYVYAAYFVYLCFQKLRSTELGIYWRVFMGGMCAAMLISMALILNKSRLQYLDTTKRHSLFFDKIPYEKDNRELGDELKKLTPEDAIIMYDYVGSLILFYADRAGVSRPRPQGDEGDKYALTKYGITHYVSLDVELPKEIEIPKGFELQKKLRHYSIFKRVQ